ncbi:unnamed protein product [Didymodactylos carnosus]|uniref:Uncharacterized protein n=1 Tax=Didymodactylos carnosus TaxID=1234261 RepID=A0A814IIF4_9BILA|nr:unnamed protein product [Didymodactylos carnosus]CAF1309755.1 unnamed protein product [Didymodactylos carnosus]CAF3795613.1 unnamed protein product [Didymodactylos carnosus]CAF4117466.1 unnamed protein product [Didymodactylos carnosus]
MPAITSKPLNASTAVQSGPYTKAQFQSTMEGSRSVKNMKEIETLLKDYPAALDLYKTGKYKVKVKYEADVERVILVEKRSAKAGEGQTKSQIDSKQNTNTKLPTVTNSEQVTTPITGTTYDQQDNASEDTLNDNNNNKRDHSESRQSTDGLLKHSKFNGNDEHHRHSRTHSKDSRNRSKERPDRPPPSSLSTQHANITQMPNNYQSYSSGKISNGTQKYENGHSARYSKDKDIRKLSKGRQSNVSSKTYSRRSTSNDSGKTKSRQSSKNRRRSPATSPSNSSFTSNNSQKRQHRKSKEMSTHKTVLQHRSSKGSHTSSYKTIHEEYMQGKLPALAFRKTKWNPATLPLNPYMPNPYWPSQQNIFAAVNQPSLRPFRPNLYPTPWQPSHQQVPFIAQHPSFYYGPRPNVKKPSVRPSASPPRLNSLLTPSTPSSGGLRSHQSGRPNGSAFNTSMYSAPIVNNFRFHHPGNAYVMNGPQYNSVNQSWFNAASSIRNGRMPIAAPGQLSLQADYKRSKYRARSVDAGPGLRHQSQMVMPMNIRDRSIDQSLNNQQKQSNVVIEQYRHHHHNHRHHRTSQNHYQSQPVISNGTVNEQKPVENGHMLRGINSTNGGLTNEKMTIRQLNEAFQHMDPTGRLQLPSIVPILQRFNMQITENELINTAQQLQYNSKNNTNK